MGREHSISRRRTAAAPFRRATPVQFLPDPRIANQRATIRDILAGLSPQAKPAVKASDDTHELPAHRREGNGWVPAPGIGQVPAVPYLQAKLEIGAVDDPREREADRIADQVMRMSPPKLSLTSTPTQINRKCAACEKEDEDVQKPQTKCAGSSKPVGGMAPSIVHDVIRSPGQPIDAPTRAFFEPRFSRDFSQVRVHADDRAAASAHAVGAIAFAVGPHVAFAAGRYDPTTYAGRQIFAHELAHVVQYTSGNPPQTLHRKVNPFISSSLQEDSLKVRMLSRRVLKEYLFGTSNPVHIFGPSHPWTLKMKEHPHMKNVRNIIKLWLRAYCKEASIRLQSLPYLQGLPEMSFSGSLNFDLNELSDDPIKNKIEILKWLAKDIINYISSFRGDVGLMNWLLGQEDAFIFGSFRLDYEIINPICAQGIARAHVDFYGHDTVSLPSMSRIPMTTKSIFPEEPFGKEAPFNNIELFWDWSEELETELETLALPAAPWAESAVRPPAHAGQGHAASPGRPEATHEGLDTYS